MSTPTQITIYPDRDLTDVARFPSSAKRLAGQRYQFGPTTTTADGKFFGEDGFGIRDVVDALNPLEHIPFVSTLYEQFTGHQASTASKLVGGALIGGPIGFLASLADVIFEQETGHTAGGAVVAALMGEEKPAPTQVASAADIATDSSAAKSTLTPVADTSVEILPPEPKPAAQKISAAETPMKMASAMTDAAVSPANTDQDVLALFGSTAKSAHASYRNAQFKPYLNDVTQSMVL